MAPPPGGLAWWPARPPARRGCPPPRPPGAGARARQCARRAIGHRAPSGTFWGRPAAMPAVKDRSGPLRGRPRRNPGVLIYPPNISGQNIYGYIFKDEHFRTANDGIEVYGRSVGPHLSVCMLYCFVTAEGTVTVVSSPVSLYVIPYVPSRRSFPDVIPLISFRL